MNEIPRMACTSRMLPRVLRPRARSKTVAAEPRSPPAPYTLYTMFRSSTTNMGSATAVPRLSTPEEEEADDEGKRRPADAEIPEVQDSYVSGAVRAVGLNLRRHSGAV